ncbi:ABC transporter substrate-binding protein [Aureimonas endophytica]|uniref:ABC transporter substrate-binding protein n=1 Tax=Aureimonas endophytica TaxID=2027858 RepID=A0A916ZER9_9HYPH|nr:DUF1007 family protein [Aureimonas endophytica]GGD92821.1 ABC transporter substrate-binding protein [Aureimonas endophytica]
MTKTRAFLAAAAFAILAAPGAAKAHPHVFVEPRIEIDVAPDGRLQALRNDWSMDEMFSSSVVVDFDKNGDGKLDKDELAAIGKQVAGSIARWSYYTFVRRNGVVVAMQAPPALDVSYDEKRGRLRFQFALKPKEALDVKAGDLSFSNFDDTYFVAFDFKGTKDFVVKGMPAGCRTDMNAPSPDEAAKSWMASIAAIPADAPVPDDGIKFSQVLSTKFQVTCRKG